MKVNSVVERLAIESMNMPMPQSFDIPPLPRINPPPPIPTDRPNPPIRSKSLHSPRSSKEEHTPYLFHVNRSATMLSPPPDFVITSNARPSSWQSVSTSSSSFTNATNASPLFDMFDAFPDVPDSPPMPSPPGYSRPISSFASLGTAVPRSAAIFGPSSSTATMHDFPESQYMYHAQ